MAGSPDGPLEALENLVQGYVGWTERLSRWLEGNGPAIRRFLEGVNVFYEGFPIALMAASATFARGGWSEVPLANMNLSETTDLLERLRDKPDDEVRRELDGVIPAYFRRDGYAELEELVDGWHEHFGRRHETFEQALFAHKEGLYRLSIPALAAQVEGVLRDLTKEHGTFGGKWIKRFNEAFGFDHGPSDLPPPPNPERLAAEFLAIPARERYEALEELRARFALVRINELFASGTYGDPEFASSVRRHSILHGAFEAYGELQSLRLFFLLEVLHDAVGRYKERVWLVDAKPAHSSVLEEWKADDPDLEEPLARFLPPQVARSAQPAAATQTALWIAYHGGEVAGVAALETYQAGGPGRLDFFVAEPFRCRGVGAKVVRLAIDKARLMGLPGVTVGADRVGPEDGPAARCLARAGFAPPDAVERAYLLRLGTPPGPDDGGGVAAGRTTGETPSPGREARGTAR